MEQQIHHLEKEAYYAVLLAFKAQSHELTWDRESLMTDLRKELRVLNDEHREVLSRVNNAEVICRTKEWRNSGGRQITIRSHPTSDVSGLTYASRKKQRTIQSFPTHGGSSSAGAISSRPRGEKSRQLPYNDHALHGTIMSGSDEDLVGKKIMIKWPGENHYCEALISRYNPSDGRHALVYDIHTPKESFEWVDFKEMPFEDFRWVDEETVSSDRGGPGERRSLKFKIVEKVVGAPNPDRFEIGKAKQMLKEHEQALTDAISRLSHISDPDINDGDQQC